MVFGVDWKVWVFIVVFHSLPINKEGNTGAQTTPTWKVQQWKTLKRISFLIEHYHRGLKQNFLVEKCQARKIHIQTAYICVCLCSFAKIQRVRQRKRISVSEIFKRIHRKRIEQSRIPSSTCEFLWNSKRCGWGSHEEGFFPTYPRGRAPGRRRSPRSDAEEFLWMRTSPQLKE